MRKLLLILSLLYCVSLQAQTKTTGAYVATLGQLAGASTDFNFVIPGAANWVTNRDLSDFDFSTAFDVAPGSGNTWTLTLEWATLAATQRCQDISSWNSVALGTISGTTQKGLTVLGATANIVAPACFHGRAIFSGSSRNNLNGGTASFHFVNGPVHFQSSGADTFSGTTVANGNVIWVTAGSDRPFWISPGVGFNSVSGLWAVNSAPGNGNTWTVTVNASTTALTAGQNCIDLTYVKTGVGTVTGATQKMVAWSNVAINLPPNGCVQVEAICTGTCFSGSIFTQVGIDFDVIGVAAYTTAGSGAFDAAHSFGIGPWAISDLKPVAGSATLGQQYWPAPSTGLKSCAGAITFQSAVGGTGQFDFGLRVSTTTPTSVQGALDLSYTNSGTLCSIASGTGKSCFFNLTGTTIPAFGMFAINVATSGGTPTMTDDFNWEMICMAGDFTQTTIKGTVPVKGGAIIK